MKFICNHAFCVYHYLLCGRYSTQYFYSVPFSELDSLKSQFHHKFYRGKKIPAFIVGGNKYYGKNISIESEKL